MARPLRIDYPNAWHHVMNRARRGEKLFLEESDHLRFIEILQDTCDLFNIRLAAFCLMSNHYHLLVNTPDANLARCMRHINGVYTQRYNVVHGCDGTLFRGRYKSILVDADAYLLQLVRYIHRNPLKAGLVDRLDRYNWSSHKGYLSNQPRWDWLYKSFVMDRFGPNPSIRIREYRRFMAAEEDQELLDILDRASPPPVLGGEAFISWVKDRFFANKRHREVPTSRKLAPEIDVIIATVAQDYGFDIPDLKRVRRGRAKEARDAAIYLARRLRAEPLESIASHFGVNHPSSVSVAVGRVKQKMQEDRAFRERMAALQEALLNHKYVK